MYSIESILNTIKNIVVEYKYLIAFLLILNMYFYIKNIILYINEQKFF